MEEAFSRPTVNHYLGYRACSRYYWQLEQYWPYSKAQVLILTQDELARERRQAMQKAFRFLAVDDSFSGPQFHTRRNRSAEQRRRNRAGMC